MQMYAGSTVGSARAIEQGTRVAVLGARHEESRTSWAGSGRGHRSGKCGFLQRAEFSRGGDLINFIFGSDFMDF